MTKIRFRTIRYKDDGVEDIQESSDNEALKVDSAAKPKDSPDIIWTKRFGEDRKYKWSEVQVLSIELRDIFRVQFAHDPRLHIVAVSKQIARMFILSDSDLRMTGQQERGDNIESF